MRIGIDYTSAAHQGAGIGRLTRNIVEALAEIDDENEYTLLIQGRDLPYASQPPGNDGRLRNAASGITGSNFREVRTRVSERWWNRIWHRLRLPIAVEWLVGPVQVFHSPDFVLPPVQKLTRTIVTVHDLSFMRLPHCFEPALLRYLRVNVPHAVHRADWVLADSQSTRQDVIDLLHAPPEKVSVLYPGVEPRFRPIADKIELERVRQQYGLPARFILSVGTLQPRKNHATLVDAFSRLAVSDVELVIVGQRGWLYADLLSQVRGKALKRVHFAGFVQDADLPAIYNLADVVALPSLYEGFGLPALEAMACGIPVVTADNSSLPEVVGDAGLLVQAMDTQALTVAMERLLSEAALREALIARGLARAAGFTWHKAAQDLLATYVKVGQA